MKYFACMILLCTAAIQLFAQKRDTLKYDQMTNLYSIGNDQYLVAVSQFPGEVEVVYNMRFTPAEKCSLEEVQVAFGLVKFQPLTGEDSILVYVYDAQENTQPYFVNVVKTYKVGIGDQGFPAPNIETNDPFASAVRDVLTIKLNPPVLISPKRDMIVGVKAISRQKYGFGPNQGFWNGFSLLMKSNIPAPNYFRFRRYQVGENITLTSNKLATENGKVGIWIRAIVRNDPSLPPTILTEAPDTRVLSDVLTLSNFPNPISSSHGSRTTISYSLPKQEHVALHVVNALGQEVTSLAHGEQSSGSHDVNFNASSLPAGVYFARLRAGASTRMHKMLIVK